MYPEYPTEPKGETRYNKDINCFKKRKAFIAGAKWMQEQDGWISVDTPPMKINGVSELYVLASEDEDCLTVEKVFYDTKDNTYWIPFCKEQYFPKWYCYLPSPPKTK